MTRHSRQAQAADADLAPDESKLADTLLFTRKLLAKGRAIAAVTPSGSTLSRTIIQHLDFSTPGVIVELGAGTGAITKHLVSQLQPHHRFITVEIDPDFVEILRQRFPQHTVLRADATNLGDTLVGLGVKSVKYIVSGMATPSLPVRGQERLHHWMREMLDPTGAFAQITFIPNYSFNRHTYHRYYARLFQSVEFHPVWRNVPPGGVFICRQIRDRIAPRKTKSPRRARKKHASVA